MTLKINKDFNMCFLLSIISVLFYFLISCSGSYNIPGNNPDTTEVIEVQNEIQNEDLFTPNEMTEAGGQDPFIDDIVSSEPPPDVPGETPIDIIDTGTPDQPKPDQPSGTPDCHNPSSWPSNWVSFEDRAIAAMNQKRANGTDCPTKSYDPTVPLALNTILRESARCHSVDMAGFQCGHPGSDGSDNNKRIHDLGYNGDDWGENVACGGTTPEATIDAFMKHEGHCELIMNPHYNEVGVGYYYKSDSQDIHYWSVSFGHIRQ